MKNTLSQLLTQAKYTPEKNLSELILQRISHKERIATNIRFWSFASISLISFSGILYTLFKTKEVFAQSGFYEYMSLVFSNSSAVTTYWKEFLLTLTEALPITNILLSCSLLFVFILAIRFMMKQTGKTQSLLAA